MPKTAAKKPTKRKKAAKPKEYVQVIEDRKTAITSVLKDQASIEALPKCKYGLCKKGVDAFGFAPYCSLTCAAFDQKRAKNNTLYREEYASSKLWEYLKHCELSHDIYTYALVEKNLVTIKRPQLPDINGYALFIGRSHDTLYKWAQTYPEFKEAVAMIHSVQRVYLMNKGLAGEYTPQIAKLLLSARHGMVERKEVKNTHLIGVVKQVYEGADKLELGEQSYDDIETSV